jgi:hypothetical protein
MLKKNPARIEPLERRTLLAADIEVMSVFGTLVTDGDTTPAEGDGTDFGTAQVGDTRPLPATKTSSSGR